MESIYFLSYGGGVNSSALFFYLLEKNMPLNFVIFSDTGEESDETYQTTLKMENICKEKNIHFIRVQSKYGRMLEHYFKKKSIMSIMSRDCTSKFKIAPIRQYLRLNYDKKQHFIQYLGIAWDEAHRVNKSPVKYITHSFPFVDDKINRKGNEDILNKYNFHANKSGCVGCPFQSKKKWAELCITNLKEFERWENLEINNKKYPRLLINATWNLSSFKRNILNQKNLNKWLNDFEHKHEDDLNCPNTTSGCFL